EEHQTKSKDISERNNNKGSNGHEKRNEGFAGAHSSGAVAQKTLLQKFWEWRHRNKALGCGFAGILIILITTFMVLSTEGNCVEDQTGDVASIFSNDECLYQTVCGNETDYHQFKNGTTISLKLNNVQEELRVVTGITLHHRRFPIMQVLAQIEITYGTEGLVLKGTADNDLINNEESWNSEPLHILPSIGDTFRLGFSLTENKLRVSFVTNNFTKILILSEDFMRSEDVKIRLGTYESDVPYQVCFLDS
ncbi:unnamed protein product, partial [Meganyctiphanes norvegica]